MATHLRAERGRRTNNEHYPPEKIAFYQRTPVWCRRTARDVGPACVEVITGLLGENALYRLRAAQGVLGLKDKYGSERLEAACAAAITAGDPSHRTIKGLLVAGLEATQAVTAREEQERRERTAGVPAFLRGQEALFDTPDHAVVPSVAVIHMPTTSPSTNRDGTTSEPAGTTSRPPGTTSMFTTADGTLSVRTSPDRRLPAPRMPVFTMAVHDEATSADTDAEGRR